MRLVFDVEANGLVWLTFNDKKEPKKIADRIWCLCIKDVDTNEVYRFSLDNVKDGVQMLREADLLIGHNIMMYDLPLIYRLYGGFKPRGVYDTLIRSRLMFGPPQRKGFPLRDNNNNPSHSLEAWGRALKFPKKHFEEWDRYSEEMVEYCVNDVELGYRIHSKCVEIAPKYTIERASEIEHEVHAICAEMTSNGFRFDLDRAEQTMRMYELRANEIRDNLQVVFPPIVTERYSEKTGKRLKDEVTVFNPGSDMMIAERLKEKYGWIAPRTPSNRPSCKYAVLDGLEYPEAKLLCEYAIIEKKLGYLHDWVKRASLVETPRIHPSFDPLMTATGRMSSSQPNIQQIDKDPNIRSLFVADIGWSLVGCDAAGLEGRLGAAEAGKYDNGVLADKLINGDMHTENLNMFKDLGCASRDNAKTLFYGGFLYGASDEKTGSILGRDKATGALAKRRYYEANPVIEHINEVAKFELQSTGFITLIDGRKVAPLWELNKWGKWVKPKHKALNYKLQGNGAVLMKVALILAHKRLSEKYDKATWKLLGIIHDEIQATCVKSIDRDVGELLAQAIVDAGVELGFACPMKGEYKIGDNWSKTH